MRNGKYIYTYDGRTDNVWYRHAVFHKWDGPANKTEKTKYAYYMIINR